MQMSRITAPVGEVTTPITRAGWDALSRRVEQAFRRKLPLALLEQRHERADAGGLQPLDDDLVLRFSRKGGDAPGGDELDPVLRLHPQAR
jgi:hypothetical protein